MPSSPMPAAASEGTAAAHASRLLADLDSPDLSLPAIRASHPDTDWGRFGGAHLSGPAPAPLTACMRGAWAAASAFAPGLEAIGLEAPALLCERAALSGLSGRGRTTAGGAGRLARTREGWLAFQLPRPDDIAAVPAWLECDAIPDERSAALDAVEARIAHRDASELVHRAGLVGLAVAALPSGSTPRLDWLTWQPARARPSASRASLAGAAPLRILDLSTLWAGPLCARILALMGADVVKVESPARIDGARVGPTAFFDAMNGDKSSLALDPSTEAGRRLLLDAIGRADVVIESARPRGLAQLGIDAESLVEAHAGLTWVSITGYGRTPPHDAHIAFGDDAAVAAGVVGRDADGSPIFCGDAIADPLTGVHAALAALAGAHARGGLFDVSLAGVASMALHTRMLEVPAANDACDLREPSRITALPSSPARHLGVDTEAVCARWHLTAGATPGC